jgi:hypothetical protein
MSRTSPAARPARAHARWSGAVRDRGERHQPALAASAAVGEEQIRAARGAEPRVVDPRVGQTGAPELIPIGLPEVEHPLARPGGRDPGAPGPGEGRFQLRDHRQIHLVAARPDRRADGGHEPLRTPPRLDERLDGHPCRGQSRPPPAGMRHGQPAARRIVDDHRHAVGREDRQGEPGPLRHQHVRLAQRPGARRHQQVGAVDLPRKGEPVGGQSGPVNPRQRARVEGPARISPGPHSGKVSRAEQMRQPGLGQERRREVEGRLAMIARTGKSRRHDVRIVPRRLSHTPVLVVVPGQRQLEAVPVDRRAAGDITPDPAASRVRIRPRASSSNSWP